MQVIENIYKTKVRQIPFVINILVIEIGRGNIHDHNAYA